MLSFIELIRLAFCDKSAEEMPIVAQKKRELGPKGLEFLYWGNMLLPCEQSAKVIVNI